MSTQENDIKVVENRKYSKATSFILPMIGHPLSYFKALVHCYIADFEQEDNDLNFNKIFILTLENNDQLIYNHYFLKNYRTKNNGYMYVFDVPVVFVENYQLFLDGKYSHFTTEYKDFLVSKITRKDVMTSVIYKVLYRTADARKQVEDRVGQKLPLDAEVLSALNFAEETYGFSEIEQAEKL